MKENLSFPLIKYEVAPGYMGVVEFQIPTEVIKDALVSHEYIK